MAALASLADLEARLSWTLSEGEKRDAQGALDDLSDWARFYGRNTWQPGACPSFVSGLVLRAAQRYMKNPDGFEQSRAGDETLMWGKKGDDAGAATFTDSEIKALGALVRPGGGFGSIEMVAWDTSNRMASAQGYVPVDYGGEPFPLFTSDGDPW